MAINAGNLRERVTIYRPEIIRSENGEQIQEWKPCATVRVQVLQQKTSRAFSNGEVLYPTARSFKMRIPPEVKGGYRIVYRDETYVCLPPKVFVRERYQEVDCELLNE